MIQVDNLSNDANQLTTVILADGSALSIQLVYRPAIQRWTINISRENFILNGANLCIHPNMLRTWINLIPFGIACTTIDGADPLYIDDFQSGRVSLFVLDEADVQAVEEQIIGAAA